MEEMVVRSPALAGTPRIPPLARRSWGRELADVAEVAGPLNVFTTIGRHDGLFAAWIGFAALLLLDGRLSARHREIAILRSAHLSGCGYIRDHHEPLGRDAGLTGPELRALSGQAELDWPPSDQAVMLAVDALHSSDNIDDRVWRLLAAWFDDVQLIELAMLVGHYQMLAWTLNALRVQPDDPGEHLQ